MKLTFLKTLLPMLILVVAMSSYAQEKREHDLVSDGDPVPGMSAQQGQRPTGSSDVTEKEYDATTRVPMIQQSTLEDEEFNSWRAGEIFRDNESKQDASSDSVKIIERPRKLEEPRR